MGFRVENGTVRPPATQFRFDSTVVVAFPGETIAAALLAAGVRSFRRDTLQRPRAPYCNMGTCFECIVEVRRSDVPADGAPLSGDWRRVRACLTLVHPALEVRTADMGYSIEPAA